MAGMVGMNVEEVRTLAKQMDTAAQQIETLARQIGSKLNSTTWVGNDFNTFKSDWEGQHMTAITNVVNAVRTAGQKAGQNATDQENVSNA
ncbi:MAG: WXG100 family type VII secretion target [Aeromicrobium sp.]|uniref:WXG100 family type VII secretion target n=1 Tax=Aeromicrobium sp. TaxID=1871063 RepID=UPI0039E51F6C